MSRDSFWGIFYIDASSAENAAQSFSSIATVGRVAPNQRAAKNWLSTVGSQKPWLLIIDNADEATLSVEDYFPDGSRGNILITTRNPMLKVHGTAGPGYYHFNELEERESVELLLKAASEPLPWSQSALASARDISKTLGHSPLVLLHAGRTILARQCTLGNYLSFFEQNWSRIRNLRNRKTGTPISDENAAIYSSYELIHDSLLAKRTQASEDALDLLKIFSFFHRQRIRIDIFLRAATNPKEEKNAELTERREQERGERIGERFKSSSRPRLTWKQTFKRMGIETFSFLLRISSRPVLPRFLCDNLESGVFDEVRLRQALRELFQTSLISADSDSKDDSYSIHPAVHLWIRERPEMTLKEQAVWCQMAATILSQAMLLPPLGDKEEDEILRRDLLPHVNHVQRSEQAIQAMFLKNQEYRSRLWPVLQPRLDRQRALQLVKFSTVLAQGDQLRDAEKLQTYVADYAIKTLGLEHESTMNIMLLLSKTYWELTKSEEAADLQKRVLEACLKVRGKDDLKTLMVMDRYGSSRWLQGRVVEARLIHEAACEGLQKVLGENHIDTLKAMGNLGRAVGKDFEFTKAIDILSKALKGLRAQLPDSHLETVIAMDNLAMAYYDRAAWGYGHAGDLERALKMELEVFQIRKEKLGREHLYTLWSGLNLARIKAAQGEADEALSIFLAGHEIAVRNLGETHFGVLLGKTHWGRILMLAGNYAEAEVILSEVVNTYEGRRQRHPDRLLALFSLIKCRNLTGKAEETTVLLEELRESTTIIFSPNHPTFKYLLDPENLSQQPDVLSIWPEDSVDITPTRIFSVEKPLDASMIAKYGHI